MTDEEILLSIGGVKMAVPAKVTVEYKPEGDEMVLTCRDCGREAVQPVGGEPIEGDSPYCPACSWEQ